MSKHWKSFKNIVSKCSQGQQEVNMESNMELLRKSYETFSTKYLKILRNFQFWPKFLANHYKKQVNASLHQYTSFFFKNGGYKICSSQKIMYYKHLCATR